MPIRIKRERTAGWTVPPGALYVGRGRGAYGRWGNPFVVGVDADDREHATALFREWLEYDSATALDPYGSTEYRQQMSDRREWMLAHAADLAGRDLMCWCALPAPGEPDHCHGAVLLELAAGDSSSLGGAR